MNRWTTLSAACAVALLAGGAGIVMPVSVQAGAGPAAASPAPLKAPASGIWRGTSTNLDRNFNYGPVSMKVRKGVITNFLIEGVTVSGCGGYKSIVVPRLVIRGTKVSGSYQPIPGINDEIKVTGSFAGGAFRGVFTEGPLCQGAGRFIARPT